MAENKECPTCGRTDFKNRHGMLLHHANAHGESLVEVTRECDECGGEFQRHESRVDINGHNFCSDQCSSDYLGREHSGEDSWHWKGDELVVECAYCGKETRTNTEKIERNEMHYCSRECADKHRAERFTGEDHPNYNSVEAECGWCGETLIRCEGRVDLYERQFCDTECMGKWRSENVVGENHPNWNGIDGNPAQWNHRLKDAVRSRDSYRCQDCGMTNEEHKAKYGKALHVHHIVPRRSFDDQEKSNEKSNLITLCYQCHLGKWEKIRFLRPQ